MHHHAGRLVDDDEIIVGVEDHEREVLGLRVARRSEARKDCATRPTLRERRDASRTTPRPSKALHRRRGA
jgi:hypothetical protein